MNKKTEIFENEEATKLLDYFVAYKKLESKVEYIKCVSALNSEVHFNQTPPPIEMTQTPEIQAEITLSALEK